MDLLRVQRVREVGKEMEDNQEEVGAQSESTPASLKHTREDTVADKTSLRQLVIR